MVEVKARFRFLSLALFLLVLSPLSLAAQGRLVVVMDDLGNQHSAGLDAIGEPWVSTVAIMPGRPFTKELAKYAHSLNKEIIVHAPMANLIDFPLGPMGLTREGGAAGLKATLFRAIDSVPFAVGVSNHMGSRLTQDPEAMRWLMHGLREKQLFFFDSRTIATTIGWQTAQEQQVPWSMRHFFLDHFRTDEFMMSQWQKIRQRVIAGDTVTVITHPYPETLDFLRRQVKDAELMSSLVPLSDVLNYPVRYARRQQRFPEGE